MYSISNEFRTFASPFSTLTVTVPYLYRTPTVPHRTHRFLKFFSRKKLKKRWVRWGTVRYGDGAGTVL